MSILVLFCSSIPLTIVIALLKETKNTELILNDWNLSIYRKYLPTEYRS